MYNNTAHFINVNKRFSKHSTAFQSVANRSFNLLSLADIIIIIIGSTAPGGLWPS
jgi:hypothetical protein